MNQPANPAQYAPAQYGQAPAQYGQAPAPAPKRKSSAGKIISIIASAVVVLGGLATAALFLFGPRTLDENKIQDEIVKITQQAAGVAPTDVHCPKDVKQHAGDDSTCTATVDGQQVTYTVHQDDDKGNVHIQSKGYFVQTDKAEKTLADQVGKNTGATVTADCADGKQVVVADKGTTFPCTVTDTADPTDTLKVTATVGDNGTIDFS